MSLILGLGSNLGDKNKNFDKAISLLSQDLQVVSIGPFIETDPVDYLNQPQFLNGAIECKIPSFGPEELLNLIKKVEVLVGRTPTFNKGPRIIDIDILFWDHLFYQSDRIVIPHPQSIHRPFIYDTVKDLPFFQNISSFSEFKILFQSLMLPKT